MKTRVVPASELDPKKGLRASDYIEVPKSSGQRLHALSLFRAARSRYLSSTGWQSLGRATPSTPMFWKSPYLSDTGREFSSQSAADHQEMLDVDLSKDRR